MQRAGTRLTRDVFAITSLEQKTTRLVSVNLSMKKKLRGCGGGSFHRELGDDCSCAGGNEVDDVS